VFSRCQRFDFRLIPFERIVERLEQICKTEKITCEREVLMEIARAAGGGMRDAQSVLDQVVSYGIEGISPEDIRKIIGSLDPEVIRELTESVFTGDISGALSGLNDIIDAGANINELVSEIITFIRNTIVFSECGRDSELMPALDKGHAESMKRILEMNSVEKLLLASKMLEDFLLKSRYLVCQRVLLEITIINILKCGNFMSIEELIKKADSLPEDQPAARTDSSKKISSIKPAPVQKVERVQRVEAVKQEADPSVKTSSFFSQVGREDRILGAMFSAEGIEGVLEDNRFTLDVKPGTEFPENKREMFEMHEEWQTLIKEKADEVFGSGVTVVFRFLQPSEDNELLHEEESHLSYDEEAMNGMERDESPLEKSDRIRRYEPIVDKIIEVFKGKVLNVQEK
jgi:DNA polymerase III gamma/tau subunit